MSDNWDTIEPRSERRATPVPEPDPLAELRAYVAERRRAMDECHPEDVSLYNAVANQFQGASRALKIAERALLPALAESRRNIERAQQLASELGCCAEWPAIFEAALAGKADREAMRRLVEALEAYREQDSHEATAPVRVAMAAARARLDGAK